MNEQDKLTLEKYLDGSLDKKSKEEFELKLHSDPALQKLLEEEKKTARFWKELHEYESVKKAVKEASRQVNHKKSFKIGSRYWYWAASLLLLAGLALLLFQKSGQKPQKSLSATVDSTAKPDSNLKIKKDLPKHYATVQYANKNIQLIFPDSNTSVQNNQTIRFQWQTTQKGTTFLKIIKKEKEQQILSLPVKLEDGAVEINFNVKPGEYYWQLGDGSTKTTFRVTTK
jgi:hypothetical protein